MCSLTNKILGTLVLLFAGVVVGHAQFSDLSVTGTITNVSVGGAVKMVNGRRVLKDGIPEREETYYGISFKLTYHNRGDEPIIVPKPRAFYEDSTKVEFLNIPSSDGGTAKSVEAYLPIFREISAENLARWKKQSAAEYRSSLDDAEPSSVRFVIIEPGGFREIISSVRIKSGYKIEVRYSSDRADKALEALIPEYPYFRIRYALSIPESDEPEQTLRAAQARWKRFGKLLLTSNGSLALDTGVIINTL